MRRIHLVWRKRRQSPAYVVRHWTSSWESSLGCCNTCAQLHITYLCTVHREYVPVTRIRMSSSSSATSNTVALSLPRSLLFPRAPCSALCSSPSSSPSAAAASPPTAPSGYHRTWRGSLVDRVLNLYGATCPLRRTSASGSGYDPGRQTCTYPCFHLEEQTCVIYSSLWASVLPKLKTIHSAPSVKLHPPGIMVWLSCRDVISLWNLCCAEQRFRRYCAIFELSVTKLCFFPLGPPHSIISLRRWKTDTSPHTFSLIFIIHLAV